MKGFILLLAFFTVFLGGCSSNNKHTRTLDSGEYSFIRGMNLYQKGKKPQALEEYKAAYKKSPKNTLLLKEMGALYSEFNDLDKAIESFEKAYKQNKSDIDVIKNISYLYYAKGNFDSSLEYLKKIPNGDTDDFVLKLKGYIEHSRGNIDLAYKYLSDVKDVIYDKKYYDEFIQVSLKVDQKNKLKEILESKYQLYHNEKNFILQLAEISDDAYYKQEAIKKLLKYISEYDGEDGVYMQLASLYIDIGQLSKAADSIKLVSNVGKETSEYKVIYDRINNRS